MFTEILNPFLNVRNKVKNRTGLWVDLEESMIKSEEELYSNSGDNIKIPLSPTNDVVVEEYWGGNVIIDSLVISAKGPVQPKLIIEKDNPVAYNDQIFHIVTSRDNSTARNGAGLEYIDRFGHDFLEVTSKNRVENDEGEELYTYYVASLKKPIFLPKGFQLSFNLISGLFNEHVTDDFNVTYKIIYRKIK